MRCYWLAMLLILLPLRVDAQTFIVQAVVQGSDVQWKHILPTDGGDTLLWQPVVSNEATSAWVPGGLVSFPSSNVTFTSPGPSFDAYVDIKGFQYHIGGSGAVEGADASSLPGSVNWTFSPPEISLIGAGVRAARWLEHMSPTSPFAFIRPVFAVDDASIADGLLSTGAINGTYRGRVDFSVTYFIKSYQGVAMPRVRQHSLVIELIYEPNQVMSASISGSLSMTADYDVVANTVSAEAIAGVNIVGNFHSGVSLTLRRESAGDVYQLEHEHGDSAIPYSLDCIGTGASRCEAFKWIHSGVNSYPTFNIVVDSPQTVINFDLKMSYGKDMETRAEDVLSGLYQETLWLSIEPIL